MIDSPEFPRIGFPNLSPEPNSPINPNDPIIHPVNPPNPVNFPEPVNPFNHLVNPRTIVNPPEPVKEVAKPETIEVHFNEPEHRRILREHGGQESNIPINSPYWRLRP